MFQFVAVEFETNIPNSGIDLFICPIFYLFLSSCRLNVALNVQLAERSFRHRRFAVQIHFGDTFFSF